MQQPPAPRRTPGRPARISREDVLAAARRIVDAEGADRLTMRRLATETGTTPMALYHHVRNKEELLVLLLDDHAARTLHRPGPDGPPRERVVAAAAAVHDALATCPWIVDVLTADDVMSTSALWFVDRILGGLTDCGLTTEQAVHGYRAIWYYTAGEILVRATAAARRADDAHPTYRDRVLDGPTAPDPAELPHLARAAGRWAALTAQDTYLDGLRALVDGLTARTPAQAENHPAPHAPGC